MTAVYRESQIGNVGKIPARGVSGVRASVARYDPPLNLGTNSGIHEVTNSGNIGRPLRSVPGTRA